MLINIRISKSLLHRYKLKFFIDDAKQRTKSVSLNNFGEGEFYALDNDVDVHLHSFEGIYSFIYYPVRNGCCQITENFEACGNIKKIGQNVIFVKSRMCDSEAA